MELQTSIFIQTLASYADLPLLWLVIVLAVFFLLEDTPKIRKIVLLVGIVVIIISSSMKFYEATTEANAIEYDNVNRMRAWGSDRPLVIQKIQNFSSDGKITKFEYRQIDKLDDWYIRAYKANANNKVKEAEQNRFLEAKAIVIGKPE